MKKYLSLAISLAYFFLPATCWSYCAPSDVIVLPFCPEKCLKSGLYLGAGLGYDVYKVRQGLTLVEADGELFTVDPPLNGKGWNGGLFAGYGQYFNWFYIGGEILANITGAEASYGISSADTRYTVTFSGRDTYGLAILPGLKVSRSTLLYGRLGYMRTTFKSKENLVEPATQDFNQTTKYGNGFNIGFGIETALFCNFSLRGEYSYTAYKAFSSTFGSRFTPANNQAVVSLIYHFDHLNYFACP